MDLRSTTSQLHPDNLSTEQLVHQKSKEARENMWRVLSLQQIWLLYIAPVHSAV